MTQRPCRSTFGKKSGTPLTGKPLLLRIRSSTLQVGPAVTQANQFLPLTCVRERSAETALRISRHPAKGARAPRERRARLPALHCGDFLRCHRARLTGSDQGEPFRCSRPCCHGPSPVSLCHSRRHPHRARSNDVAPGTRVTSPRLQAPHPAPSAKRP